MILIHWTWGYPIFRQTHMVWVSFSDQYPSVHTKLAAGIYGCSCPPSVVTVDFDPKPYGDASKLKPQKGPEILVYVRLVSTISLLRYPIFKIDHAYMILGP